MLMSVDLGNNSCSRASGPVGANSCNPDPEEIASGSIPQSTTWFYVHGDWFIENGSKPKM